MLLLLSAITFIIAVASSGGGIELTGIAAIITAGIGVLGFILTLFRGRVNNKRVEQVEQTSSYLSGFESLVSRQKDEIDELRRERKSLQEEIISLRTEVREARAEASSTRGELSELKGEIRNYLSPDQFREFTRHADE